MRDASLLLEALENAKPECASDQVASQPEEVQL
jgi:hypothetical protein